MSFDYYLDPSTSVEDAASDLETLAAINSARPYHMPIHVREWSTVEKVQDIIAKLDPETFEVVPVDCFFDLANSAPTFCTRYQ